MHCKEKQVSEVKDGHEGPRKAVRDQAKKEEVPLETLKAEMWNVRSGQVRAAVAAWPTAGLAWRSDCVYVYQVEEQTSLWSCSHSFHNSSLITKSSLQIWKHVSQLQDSSCLWPEKPWLRTVPRGKSRKAGSPACCRRRLKDSASLKGQEARRSH